MNECQLDKPISKQTVKANITVTRTIENKKQNIQKQKQFYVNGIKALKKSNHR